jgi:aconitate hydratase 2/2-methylisocitrate dehydratase
MSLYKAYLEEIEKRKSQALKPKPIDNGPMVEQLISQIIDNENPYRKESLDFFIYNIIPGTTSAALVKAKFLKQIILGEIVVNEISSAFALELLSHMNGGPSVDVLLDLALGSDIKTAKDSAEVLKTQVFLYEADTDRIKQSYKEGNFIAKDILESYSKAEFYTNLPDLEEEIKIITYVAAEGDISTDLLSPGNQAHSRADRELHGKCMISEEAQAEIKELQKQNPDKRVMLIAEKGTMGVGSSRMSGVNNVALFDW